MNIRQYQLEEAQRRQAIEQELSPVELSPIYIQHLRVLASLNDLLRTMPHHAHVADVGSGCGELSERILIINHPAKLLLIDDWTSPRQQVYALETIRNKFKEEIQSGVVELCNGNVIAELSKIPDGSLDWIFLKSDNSFQETVSLLDLSRTKVKTIGIISGCNYSIGDWISMQRYGVIEAINKFCKDNGWEMIYLTNESNRLLSYALKKLTIAL